MADILRKRRLNNVLYIKGICMWTQCFILQSAHTVNFNIWHTEIIFNKKKSSSPLVLIILVPKYICVLHFLKSSQQSLSHRTIPLHVHDYVNKTHVLIKIFLPCFLKELFVHSFVLWKLANAPKSFYFVLFSCIYMFILHFGINPLKI